MCVTTYYSDGTSKLFDFERKINLEDKKHRHHISISLQDKKGKVVNQTEAKSPKYSENWLKQRMCKIVHNTYKSDLKEAKDKFEYDMFHLEDLPQELRIED